MSDLLAGLRVLILEDEFLIAMDVEQLCRDHGAAEVLIARNLDEIEDHGTTGRFDAAIIDIMLDGGSTLAFAGQIQARSVPFIFASGYTDQDEVFTSFPGVPVIGKPYAGKDLVEALAGVCGRIPMSSGG
ncbi:MAG: response regulator [Pseudaminobacter sp.]|nr:response regulator [Pseudaminobacter sp.]